MEESSTKGPNESGEFISPADVAKAEAEHITSRLNMTPAQLAIVQEVDAAMRSVESIFEGPIKDEDVNFILDVFKQSGTPDTPGNREALRSAIVRKKQGEYFALGTQVFFVTGDRAVQEAKAYVNRLEKSLIKVMQTKSDELQVASKRIADLERQLKTRTKLSWRERIRSLLSFS